MNCADNALSVCSEKYSTFRPEVNSVYNTVAIYPDIDSAKAAYLKLNQLPDGWDVFTYADIKIGDAHFFLCGQSRADSVEIMVFRKGNVVGTVACPYSPGFNRFYAQIIADKI
jgi:hypothetical protein